jgi:3D (Asp-Asp-Asp) domain-containing protein
MKKMLLLAVIVTMNVSTYCHTGNPTASGVMPQEGMCAADYINGQLVPFGTKIILPDGRTLVVTDRFGAGHNNCVDIFMNSESECWKWGRRYLKCEVIVP